MTSYKDDAERFSVDERWRELDRKDTANRNLLSSRYGFPIDEVVKRLRSPKWEEFPGADGEFVSTSELGEAPPNLTDPEFADWAVQILRSRGLV
jgi:hypothetical protein